MGNHDYARNMSLACLMQVSKEGEWSGRGRGKQRGRCWELNAGVWQWGWRGEAGFVRYVEWQDIRTSYVRGRLWWLQRCPGSLWHYSFNELKEGQDCEGKLMSSVLHLCQWGIWEHVILPDGGWCMDLELGKGSTIRDKGERLCSLVSVAVGVAGLCGRTRGKPRAELRNQER